MPAIIAKSIAILSDAGLGMAMFSLGQYTIPYTLPLQSLSQKKNPPLFAFHY